MVRDLEVSKTILELISDHRSLLAAQASGATCQSNRSHQERVSMAMKMSCFQLRLCTIGQGGSRGGEETRGGNQDARGAGESDRRRRKPSDRLV